MKDSIMLAIIGLTIALALCMLSGGVHVETSVRVKVGGKDWFKKDYSKLKDNELSQGARDED